LLSTLSKIVLLFIVVISFTSCTKKKYYSSSYYKQSPSYSKIKNQKIKNSKAMHRATMRSYVVFGKRYYPTKTHIGEVFNGIASWYGPDFHAKKTSNGEMYNMYDYTAASKTLPMNTIVRVENLQNRKTVVVRINDRGPFVVGRIIDLSNVAAHKIDMVKTGTAKVKLTVLGFHGKVAKTNKEKNTIVSVGNYFIQVGVFSKLAGAKITKKKFEMILDTNKYKVIIKKDKSNNKILNRVWLSGFKSEQEAIDFKETNNLQGAMIIAQ
jgi:rare lipoprotein A